MGIKNTNLEAGGSWKVLKEAGGSYKKSELIKLKNWLTEADLHVFQSPAQSVQWIDPFQNSEDSHS